ncbi:MAG: ferrous iron transport protein A [Faecalibacterium sp.]|nr:ferrous iron transport protein A [Ruminococcus sp.]MCM1392479.1 ferrous iron transport protein A [Ruminococcus sp.]MCM1485170.1 ferrous iron transport protein A [Faecalibacterium sp.]
MILINTLTSLNEGDFGIVDSVTARSSIRRRLQDIGLVKGTRVLCLQKSIFGDPVAYLVRDTVIAIRNEDAADITID